jgi:hypothetical protein
MEINVKEILDSGKFANTIEEVLVENIKERIKWDLSEIVDAQVKDWANEHIVPKIKEKLIANEQQILDQLDSLIDEICAHIGVALKDRLVEQMSDSWKRRKVLEELFG